MPFTYLLWYNLQPKPADFEAVRATNVEHFFHSKIKFASCLIVENFKRLG